MIKRYAFAVKSSGYDDPYGTKIVIDPVEDDEGEWVRWEDAYGHMDGIVYNLQLIKQKARELTSMASRMQTIIEDEINPSGVYVLTDNGTIRASHPECPPRCKDESEDD
jgi:hypothetical protein